MELRTAISETPTSANTAIHMLARPTVPSSMTIILIPMAKTIFCLAILMVFSEMIMASSIFES